MLNLFTKNKTKQIIEISKINLLNVLTPYFWMYIFTTLAAHNWRNVVVLQILAIYTKVHFRYSTVMAENLQNHNISLSCLEISTRFHLYSLLFRFFWFMIYYLSNKISVILNTNAQTKQKHQFPEQNGGTLICIRLFHIHTIVNGWIYHSLWLE